ncbi:MAG: sterol desaturase family protein, partial [Microcoleus sp. T3-bin5]|nr:sterol desaturase family protein [Microcoleus sp. T3-bin5]
MFALTQIMVGISCFAIAFVLASLVEYWVHRLMHWSPRVGQRHRDHHRRNEG